MGRSSKKQSEQTTVPTPEEVTQNQVAPDVPSALPTYTISVNTDTETKSPETLTESPATTTLPIEPMIQFVEKKSLSADENHVVVNKEAIYRMLVGLARGHTQSYTYERAKSMVGKLFEIQGELFQAKWEEIKEFVEKH